MRTGMLALLALLTAAIAGPSNEPIYVRTADFQGQWRSVAAPWALTTHGTRSVGASSGTRPAGTYDIAYALVDESGQLTALSDPVRITPELEDWTVVVRTPGLAGDTRAQGTAWFYRKLGNQAWYVLGADYNAQIPAYVGIPPGQCDKPFVPLSCWDHTLRGIFLYHAIWWPPYGDSYFGPISTMARPPPPAVRVLQLRNQAFEIAYSWACNDGESPLSPPVALPAVAGYPRTKNTSVLVKRGICPPQGALGAYVYLRLGPTSPWHRQPAPQGDGDYLWPVDLNCMPINQFVATNIKPDFRTGMSYLAPLQVAIVDTNRGILVTEDQDLRSPVIMEAGSSASKWDRVVAAPGTVKWRLRDRPTADRNGGIVTGYPMGWPLWCENSVRTHVVGCRFLLEYSECAVAFLDHGGGGNSFYFQLRDSVATSPSPRTRPVTYGIRSLEGSGPAPGGHTSSETKLRDVQLAADYAVLIEGMQSVNWWLDSVTLTGDPSVVQGAVITLHNHANARLTGRVSADHARAFLAVRSARPTAITTLEQVFIDQGISAWLVVGGNCFPQVRLVGNKANMWQPWLHLVEAPAGSYGGAIKLSIADLDIQGSAPEAKICARPGFVQLTPANFLQQIGVPVGPVQPVP